MRRSAPPEEKPKFTAKSKPVSPARQKSSPNGDPLPTPFDDEPIPAGLEGEPLPEDEPAVSDDPFGFSGGDSEPATAPTRDKGKFSQKSRSPEKGKAAAQDAGESGEARPAYRGAERGGSKILLYTLIFGVLALGGGITTVVLMINAKSEARKKENDAKAAKEAKIAADKAEAAKIEDAAAAATAAMAAKEAPKEAPKAASKGTKGERREAGHRPQGRRQER